MRALLLTACIAAIAASAGSALAGGPTAAAQHRPPPHKVATAICRDGTETDNTTRSACKHHGGVARWIKQRTR